jgi:hypothetical protein
MSGNNTRRYVKIFDTGWDCLLNCGRKVDEMKTLKSTILQCL